MFSKSVEIKIKNFRASTHLEGDGKLIANGYYNPFDIIVHHGGFGDKTKDCLLVEPIFKPDIRGLSSKYPSVSCTVSIIDIEGTPKHPRSLTATPGKSPLQKYLQRSFILDRADELLPGGVLTLRSDFDFDLERYLVNLGFNQAKNGNSEDHHVYFRQARRKFRRRCILNDLYDNKHSFYMQTFSEIFDLTDPIPYTPPFYGSRRRSDSIPEPSLLPSDPKEHPWEHVWKIDVDGKRFLLSFDERRDSVGTRLLKASLFIKRCVETPMREQRERRIELGNVEAETFKVLLYFLKTGKFPYIRMGGDNSMFMKLYKFADYHGMEEFQQLVGKIIARNIVYFSDSFKVREFLDLYKSSSYRLSDSLQLEIIDFEMFLSRFSRHLDVYKRSKMYDQEEELRKCTLEIVQNLEHKSDLKIIRRLAEKHKDEYLSELLESRTNQFSTADESPLSDCFV